MDSGAVQEEVGHHSRQITWQLQDLLVMESSDATLAPERGNICIGKYSSGTGQILRGQKGQQT